LQTFAKQSDLNTETDGRCAILPRGRRKPPTEPLLRRCKANDPAAWSSLFSYYAPRVYRWSMLLGLRSVEAEDVTQDVLVTVARRIHRCKSALVLNAWFYQTTRRVVANARRGQWLRRLLPVGDGRGPPFEESEAVGTAEFDLAVRSCLRDLPLCQAEVLVLGEIEGFSRREISKLLGVPEGTVASRMRQAKRAFQRRWDQAMAGRGP
jgi:RNA polymerase sigma-70 factor (ECF subfamily)